MEPELIMEKVAKASGANYSFHKENSKFQDSGPQAPVVSWLRGGFLGPSCAGTRFCRGAHSVWLLSACCSLVLPLPPPGLCVPEDERNVRNQEGQ